MPKITIPIKIKCPKSRRYKLLEKCEECKYFKGDILSVKNGLEVIVYCGYGEEK